MSFIEKVKSTITGKTAEERAYERKLISDTKKEAQKTYLEERKVQAIELAKQKARVDRETALKSYKAKASAPSMLSYWSAAQPKRTSSPFGYPGLGTIARGGEPVRRTKARKGSKIVKVYRQYPEKSQTRRFDPIWG